MKTIVFDFGGVLVDWNPRHLYRKIFASHEEMEWFLANVCTNAWNARQDAGRSFAEGIALLKEQYPAYSQQIEAYFSRWEEMLGLEIEGSRQIIQELKSKGYKLYGLSNWSAETFPKAEARFDILAQMHGRVVSGEEKLIKPDPRIYERFLERFSLRAEKCVFIDDNAANVAAAHTVGMDGIVFKNAEQLREELQKRDIL
ncbi:MAG: HAD family phosphatase [Elusimicrobiaceae bacterium]|nr:HAD family phosphatase [Elusimicrobiaceae bacterium]